MKKCILLGFLSLVIVMIIGCGPRGASGHYNHGLELWRQNKNAKAEKEFREAIRLQPDFADAHNLLGRALADQGRLAEAITENREAVRLNPAEPSYHTNLGWDFYKQGDTSQAIKEYREAVRLKPGDPDSHENLGRRLYWKGDTAEAIKEYREAVRLSPDSIFWAGMYHAKLADALRDYGKPVEAEEEYKTAVRLMPTAPGLLANFGAFLDKQGRRKEARIYWESALKYDNAHAPLAFRLFMTLFFKDRRYMKSSGVKDTSELRLRIQKRLAEPD